MVVVSKNRGEKRKYYMSTDTSLSIREVLRDI